MLAARLSCRPLQALLSFGKVLSYHRRSAYAAPLGTRLNEASLQPHSQQFQTTQVARLRTTAPSAAYEVARRTTISDPIPSFKRARRRNEDGSTTSTPLPRNEESTENLERELMWVAHKAPALSTIQEILCILIGKRGVQPTPLHYEALTLGNCDPELGSVEYVQKILREMKNENITLGAPIYNAVLKVRTVLPYSGCEADIFRFSAYTLIASYATTFFRRCHSVGSRCLSKHITTLPQA